MLIRTLVVWFLLMVVAILNGLLRNALIAPRIGEHAGHVVSTMILSVAILGIGWLVTPWIAPSGLRGGWTIGAIWLLLTLAFEFLAGHYLFGDAWRTLLADYDVTRGRIWPLVPVACLGAPVLAVRARRDERR